MGGPASLLLLLRWLINGLNHLARKFDDSVRTAHQQLVSFLIDDDVCCAVIGWQHVQQHSFHFGSRFVLAREDVIGACCRLLRRGKRTLPEQNHDNRANYRMRSPMHRRGPISRTSHWRRGRRKRNGDGLEKKRSGC